MGSHTWSGLSAGGSGWLGIERSKNPAVDMTGEYAKLNQGEKISLSMSDFRKDTSCSEEEVKD